MFFKRLFSRSNLELKINDGGRAAAGYKGQAGDCVVRSIAIATRMPYQWFMTICLELITNSEILQRPNLQEV